MNRSAETVTISLNGVEVSGSAGTTILDLARESGINIPTLCHDPHLPPAGACRLCLVEDDRSGNLLAACVTPIAPGQVITTDSPRVLENRRRILKLLLASHPDTCIVCDKGNGCTLRTLAAELGIGLIEYKKLPIVDEIVEVNPFIERDLSKCVLCGKCIRVDQELVVTGAIDYLDRGTAARPATFGDVPLEGSECTFCGACVAACPTGALMERDRVWTGTATASATVVCPYCGCGCTFTLNIKDGRVVNARPAEGGGVNRGTACVRGSYGQDYINSKERLTKPLVRDGDEFREAGWEEALQRVAEGLAKARDDHGPEAVGLYGSSKCSNEENYLFQRFTRCVIGTNNIDNGSRLYGPASRAGLGASVGYAGSTGTFDGLERSDVIFVIGADPDVSAPVAAYAVRRAVKNRGASLVVIDPRKTGLASFADVWLRPRPGTDAVLLNGLARMIIASRTHDIETVTRRTDNFERFMASLEPYTFAAVERATGVPRREMQRAAKLLAGAGEATLVYGNGITQYPDAPAAVGAVAGLAMLTGNTGQRGGILALLRENNAHGACDMGALPDYLPGYVAVGEDAAAASLAERWKCRLPARPGLTVFEMLEKAASGDLKAMFVMGENPAGGFPRPEAVKKALAGLDFLAVSDLFLTETAALADVVLPAAATAEKEGSYTNLEGRVQTSHAALQPPGESLPDGEIILRLATAMGAPLPYADTQDVSEEIEQTVPFSHPIAEREEEASIIDFVEGNGTTIGTRRRHGGLFPSAFYRFAVAGPLPPAGGDGGEYPLTMLADSELFSFGTGARSSRSNRLSRYGTGVHLTLGPAEAKALGLRDGDRATVTSGFGTFAAPVRVRNGTPRGTVVVSGTDGPVYAVFCSSIEASTGAPALKACAVKLEKAVADEEADEKTQG